MTSRKNVVKVTILGSEYTLRTESSAEHTHAVAEYVDSAISQTLHAAPLVEVQKAAVLAAMRIAGELFEERERARQLEMEMRDLSDEIRPWLPPAKRRD